MAQASQIISFIILLIVVAVVAVVGFVAYSIAHDVGHHTRKKLERKNVSFTRDGMKYDHEDLEQLVVAGVPVALGLGPGKQVAEHDTKWYAECRKEKPIFTNKLVNHRSVRAGVITTWFESTQYVANHFGDTKIIRGTSEGMAMFKSVSRLHDLRHE